MKHYSFPSIEQYRNVVKEVQLHSTFIGLSPEQEPMYDESIIKPVITFKGTVKLHGTNSSIVKLKGVKELQYQSKEAILNIHEDNNGFCNYMSKIETELSDWMDYSLSNLGVNNYNEYAAIYGEWCGKGIQKGTSINQLDKMFVIFGCKIDDVWIDFPFELPEKRIFNIKRSGQYEITIDFNNPEEVLHKLNELTLAVESQCPFDASMGATGIGEGIVWTSNHNGHNYRFKIKGEKHSLKAKPKEFTTLDIEIYNNAAAFVDDNLSDNRLNQGISYLKENNFSVDVKSIGEYLKWCNKDIIKECMDEIIENKLDEKIVFKKVQEKARKFFMDYINKNF